MVGRGWQSWSLASGARKEAVEALKLALESTPRNAQAISLMGYLELAENRKEEALAIFEQALAIDPALGNAWLGRGLAYFQIGDESKALRSMKIAAAVEPNRSFLRSYLGKAFAETQELDRAGKELALARRLDENDPTSYLYEALVDQRRYRLNEAVAKLEQSVELNDNRALYRSSFLLDKDRAVRQANLASLYENVGLLETGLEEARRAVVSDYLNPSSHLFLSNSINDLRDPERVSLRFETPWFNELLLANLLSPAGSDLLSQNIAQQEYSALFPGKRYGFSTRSRIDDNGEIRSIGSVQSKWGKTSLAFDYDIFNSDGDRPNQSVERYTGFLQLKHALTEAGQFVSQLKFPKFAERGLAAAV